MHREESLTLDRVSVKSAGRSSLRPRKIYLIGYLPSLRLALWVTDPFIGR